MARMSWQEACLLDPSLSSVSDFMKELPRMAEMLTGGLTNRCWRIDFSENNSVVWRPVTSVTKYFSISRSQEYQILSALKSAQFPLSPTPYHVSNQGLIVEWIEGTSLQDVDIELIIRLLSQIHQFSVRSLPVIPFSYIARLDHYWFQLESLNFSVGKIKPLYHRWRTMPDISDTPYTLCHFDLGVHNMVRTPYGIKVIDWEYATLSDPRLDLAMTILSSGEDLIRAVGCYCQYCKIHDVDDWCDAVREWYPRAVMLSMLWYFIAGLVWDNQAMGYEAERMEQLLQELGS